MDALDRRRNWLWAFIWPLMTVGGLAYAESFDRRPLARAPSGPITISPQWSVDAPGQAERRPEITLVDRSSGQYALTWIGQDGKMKEITYYEPDRVQVILRASVSAGAARKYRYLYEVMSRSTSGQDVFGVAVQNFADDVQVVDPSDGRFIGQMTKVAPEFSVGTWYRVPFRTGELAPGSVQHIALESDSPPGLVYVRVHGGPLGMKGVGEEPPEVLEASLPRFEAWPLGLTIGPVKDVRGAQYAFGGKDLNEFVELMAGAGWLSGSARADYQRLIDAHRYAELLAAVDNDIEAEKTAPEVAHTLTRLVKQLESSKVNAANRTGTVREPDQAAPF